jgi:hypothetical protein
MNIVKLQNDLKDLSDRQLLDSMQTGSAPQYLVLSEMQRRKKMRDEASTQAPQGEGTVADEIMGGITQLPMQAPQMASGGLVSFAQGGMTGYQKGEAEACWTNPETGEKSCPPSKTKMVGEDRRNTKKLQEGGVLRLLPEDPVADAYSYLQSRGAEIPTDMSEAGIVEYANRVRALDENEVKGAGVNVPAEAAPAARPSWPALYRDYGSGGRGEVMPETQLDTAPQMPMGGGEYAPGFSPVAPTQEGLPGLMAPEGPAPERAVPFLGQVMEAVVPSAQAAEPPPSATQAGLSAEEARQIMAENAPSWYDVGGRSDIQVIGDAMNLLSGGMRTRWQEQEEQARINRREIEDSDSSLSTARGINWLIGAPGAEENVGPEGNRAGARRERLDAYEQREEDRMRREDERKANTPEAKAAAAAAAEEKAKAEAAAAEGAKTAADEAYYQALEKFTSASEGGKAKDDYLDYLRRRYEGEGKKDRSLNNALMAAGLSMMASKNPDFLGSVGEGGIAGLKAYTEAAKSDEAARQKLLEEEGAYRRAQVAAEATSPYRAQEFQLKMAKELDDQIKTMSTLDYAMQNRRDGESLPDAQKRIQLEIAQRRQRLDSIMNSLGSMGMYGMMPQIGVGGGMPPGWSVTTR